LSVTAVTLALRTGEYLTGVAFAGRRTMENFSKRGILIVAAGFLLLSAGWIFAVEEMSQPEFPVVHCGYQSAKMICTPVHGA
jgi:hypothetical protein